MPVRLLRPYNGQNANTLYVGTDEAILRAIGIADDYIENATNFVPFASQAFRAFASSFSTGSPAGSFITSFSNPFAGQGRGITTYTLTGTVPPQVALSATGRTLVVGSTAAVAGTIYSVNVTATSGDGLLTTQPATLSFMAVAQAPLVAGNGGTPAPTPTPTPTPSPTLNALTVSSGSGTVGSVLSSTISGLTSGSSLSLSGAGAPGLSISGAVINGTPTTAGTVNIVETLAGATNSPRTTSGAITVSAGSAIVAPARYAAFADDFEGSNALLSTRPNWNENGTAAGNLAKWSVADGVVYMNTNFSGPTSAILGTTMTGDFIANIGYDFSGTYPTPVSGDAAVWSSSLQQYRFWQQDESNYGWIAFDPATAGGRITIGAKIGGTEQSQSYWNGVTFTASKKGDLQVEMRNAVARLKVDGKWLVKGPRNAYPYDIADLTGVIPSGNRSGYTGINAQTRRWAQAGYFGVTPLDIACTFSSDFVGTDVSLGSVGTADIKGVYTGTPTRWIFKVRDYFTGALVQDWRDMSPNTAGGAAGLPTVAGTAALFAGTVSLPLGGPYSVEHGYIGSDGLLHSTQSMGMRCGRRIIYHGQSNSRGRGEQSYVPTVFSDLAAARADTNIGSIPDGQFASTTRPYVYPGSYGLAKQLADIIGVPVGVDTRGVGSTGIDYLSPGGLGWQTFLDGVASTRGIVEAVIWDQGENDADGAFYPTGYSNTFRNTLLPGIRSATGNANIKVLISPVGRYANSVPPSSPNYPAATIDGQRETLRQQYLDIISKEPNVSFADSKLACPHGGDSYHYSGATYAEMGRREAWTVAKFVFGAAVHDGLGPKVTSATRSGAVVTLAINLNGATGLTGPTNLATGTVPTPTLANSFYGFQVSKDGFTSLLPVSGIAVSGSNLVITLASDPGSAVSVRSHYGWSYDDTNTFNGTYSDTTPIPVFPIMTALTTPS